MRAQPTRAAIPGLEPRSGWHGRLAHRIHVDELFPFSGETCLGLSRTNPADDNETAEDLPATGTE
jgi:hypothetical protein